PHLHLTTTGERIARYDGEVRNNDAALGKLVGALRAADLLQNTVLILTSDHGEYLGEAGRWGHNPPSLWPVVHVPMLIHAPARFPSPRTVDTPVGLMDLMPTILELSGVPGDGLAMMGD